MKTLKGYVLFLGLNLFVLTSCNETVPEIYTISASNLYSAIQSDSSRYIVLDVRSKKRRQASGFIKGSVFKVIGDDDFSDYLDALDKDKSYVVVCDAGVLSGNIVVKMKRKNFSSYNLTGGIDEWKQQGFPLEKN